MRTHLAAVLATLVLTTAGAAGEPQPPVPEDTPQIAFEVRVLTLSETFFERSGLDLDPKTGVLTDVQLKELLDAVQGDRRSNVLMAPKVTTGSGKEAVMQAVQRRDFVTGVDATRVNGQTVLVPRNTPVDVGVKLALHGTVASDQKVVAMRVKLTSTEVGNVEMIPVVTQVPPVAVGGKQGMPAPFTQYIQSPQIDTITIEKADLAIPSGGHALLLGPAEVRDARQEFGPPVLSKVPYVNRLFKNVGVGRETVRTALIVSPKVLEVK